MSPLFYVSIYIYRILSEANVHFQAALIKEIPTKEFLEEYARVVLQKNFESLYACGGEIYKNISLLFL